MKSSTFTPRGQQFSAAPLHRFTADATGVPKLKGALQTALLGSLAAGVAYLIAKFIA